MVKEDLPVNVILYIVVFQRHSKVSIALQETEMKLSDPVSPQTLV